LETQHYTRASRHVSPRGSDFRPRPTIPEGKERLLVV